jgi:hypothetical protein
LYREPVWDPQAPSCYFPSTPPLGFPCPATTSWTRPIYLRPHPRPRAQDGLSLPHRLARFPSEKHLTRPRPRPRPPRHGQSCAPVTRRPSQNPQAKSFKELVSQFGQRSQLAAPKYADSTKVMDGFIYGGRWTKYVYSNAFITFFFPPLRRQLNKTGPPTFSLCML